MRIGFHRPGRRSQYSQRIPRPCKTRENACQPWGRLDGSKLTTAESINLSTYVHHSRGNTVRIYKPFNSHSTVCCKTFVLRTGIRDPFRAHSISYFDAGVSALVGPNSNNTPDSFVAGDNRNVRLLQPVSVLRVQVGMAAPCVFQLDKAFSWRKGLRLLDRIIVPEYQILFKLDDDSCACGLGDRHC